MVDFRFQQFSNMIDSLFNGDHGIAPTNFQAVTVALLLAFVLGQVLAWIYMRTHTGASYSRPFVVSLLMMPVIVALVLQVLSNNLVTAFGLMAVFAIVRFRNVLRDTFDTSYVLAAIVIGMACGTEKFSTAIVGTLLIGAVMGYVRYTSFGSRPRGDVILSLHWDRPVAELEDLKVLLKRHSLQAVCADQHFGRDSEGADFSFRLWLRDPSRVNLMIDEVARLQGVSQVNGVRVEEEVDL